jgi:hypothetical protein
VGLQAALRRLGGLPEEHRTDSLSAAFNNLAERESWPAKLNSPVRVDTAPEGEDIARENWSKHEQETPPHALSGIQGQAPH